jgi:diguanylate cyclase (GGDEF)-like protein
MDRLEVAVERTNRKLGHVMVVFLDLDRFKSINDTMGHDAGDQVLQAIARRLRDAVRPNDTVARFGGDEFTILCEDIPDRVGALELAERIVMGVNASLKVEETRVIVTASLGIALGSVPAESASNLVRGADMAMYRAKEKGRSRIEFFDGFEGFPKSTQ